VKYIPVRNDGEQGLPIFVVSKPVLQGNGCRNAVDVLVVVGRIFIYTVAGTPACLHAKCFLTQKAVPFVEVNLQKYAKRLTEMDKLTKGKRTVPQIFFNDKHIGVRFGLYVL
jgi:glutaredoxin 3